MFRKVGLLATSIAKTRPSRRGGTASLAAMAAASAMALAPNSTESAIANGDTRTILLSNEHTNESGSFTYMVSGVYDSAVLDKLNWFLRDWRLNEPTKMDPHLYDIVWEVYRESGSTQPIDVLSGYRSPQTNAMLRRRSRQVAEHSQHMEGKAIDAHFVDVGTARIRDIAMRMQSGGVGFYPSGSTPWVHIDSGSVRYWPRMSREALTRLFPDGKTVFIPSDGQPMPGYELARAEIEARGGQIQTASGGWGIFAWLFGARGGGADDAEEIGGQETLAGARAPRSSTTVQIAEAGAEAVANAKRDLPTGPAYASAAPSARAPKGGPQVQIVDAGPAAVAKAKRDLPTGPTYASAPEPSAAPAKPQVVAALEKPNDASDASRLQVEEPVAARTPAPLPPRRPDALEQAALARGIIPLPPVRPADLAGASATGTPGAPAGAQSPEPGRGPDLIAGLLRRSQLPRVITYGVDGAPTAALALAEPASARKYDDDALLARAAEITAPLPPMPIPRIDWPSMTAEDADPVGRAQADPAKAQASDSGGGHLSTGWRSNLARLFGALPFSGFKASAREPTSTDGLRGAQQ